jgi:hypothetical protein
MLIAHDDSWFGYAPVPGVAAMPASVSGARVVVWTVSRRLLTMNTRPSAAVSLPSCSPARRRP